LSLRTCAAQHSAVAESLENTKKEAIPHKFSISMS